MRRRRWIASIGAILAFLPAAPGIQAVDCPGVSDAAVELGPLVNAQGDVVFQHAHAIGEPCPGASATAEHFSGTYLLSSGGSDIWQAGDQFLFAYNVYAGDFSVRVRVAAKDFPGGSRWGKLGIMARQDCGPLARYSLVHDNGEDLQDSVRFAYRANLGPGADGPGDDKDVIPAGAPKHANVIRLDRSGTVFTGYVLDETGAFGGVPGTWHKLGEHDWGADMPPVTLVGLVVNSHQGCEPATITFADYTVLPAPRSFRRGDADGDGRVTLADAAFIASRLALGDGAVFPCAEAGDANDDGAITTGDASSLITAVFGTLLLPAPGVRRCGLDPRSGLEGTLSCDSYEACSGGSLPDTPVAGLRFSGLAPRPGRPESPRDVETAVVLDADEPVHGWSLALRSTCPISSVTTSGTRAAAAGLDPAGRIGVDGFHSLRVEPNGLGVISAAVLSQVDPSLTLEPDAKHQLLRLAVEAAAPFGGCATCTLDFADDPSLRSINAVVLASGSYLPVVEASSVTTCCAAQDLAYGEERHVTVDVSSPSICLRLPPPINTGRSQAVRIRVSTPFSEGLGVTAYARWGEEGPTAVAFDGAARERYLASQTLVLPIARPEPLGILVVGDVLAPLGASSEVVVQADLIPAALSRITPDASAPALIHAVVEGGRFTEDMSFALLGPDGLERLATNVSVRWIDEAEMDFDLAGAPAGDHDLLLRRGALLLDRLPGAYRVTARRTGGLFVIELEAPASYRNGELSSLTLRYGNAGDEPLVSPLIQLRGPAGVFFSLSSEDLQPDQAQVLAVGEDGAGFLPPGVLVEVPVYFQVRVPAPQGAPLVFSASGLRPGASGRIAWSSLPWLPALPAAQRPLMAAGLESRLGATWEEYALALAGLAGTLARRGVLTTSVAHVFHFAARESIDQELGAITGQVLSVDGAPVDGAVVAALRGGATAGVAQSVGEGKFTLHWLDPGGQYELDVDGFRLLAPVSAAARGLDDPPALVLAFTDTSTAPHGYACPACEPPAIPGAPPEIPSSELIPLASAGSSVVTSHDPNTKEDEEVPGEGDPFGAICPGEEVVYRINFENESHANAPAKTVTISDFLDARLDGTTFRFLDAGFGGRIFTLNLGDDTVCAGGGPSTPSIPTAPIPPSTSEYQVVRKVCAEIGGRSYCVRVRGELIQDPVGWCATWRFETFLPDCATLATGLQDGFLLVDHGEADSEGFVRFAVRARADLQTEDDIRNDALIKFDRLGTFYPSTTTAVTLTPERPTGPIPGNGAGDVPLTQRLSWQPAEYAAGYEVFFWKSGDSRPATPALVVDPMFTPVPPLSPGTTYFWQVASVRGVRKALGALWSFETASAGGPGARFVRGDSNHDGKVDLSDAIHMASAKFLGGPIPACLDAADANDDEQFDISDPISLVGALFLGKPPPPPPTPSGGDYRKEDCGLDPSGTDLSCDAPAPKCE